jgi:basic membrane protein A
MAANIVTSSLKNVGESLLTAVKALNDGTMVMGNNYTLGLDSGAVGLAKNANYEALVSESIRAYVEEVEAKIIAGEIAVSSAFTMSTEEVVALRDSMN